MQILFQSVNLLLFSIIGANNGYAFTPASQMISKQVYCPKRNNHYAFPSSYTPTQWETHCKSLLQLASTSSDDNNMNNNSNQKDDNNDEAEKLRSKAEKLRDQIRQMEEQLQSSPSPLRSNNNDEYIKIPPKDNDESIIEGKSLKNKRVLVVGANGRLGSMVTRYLLRTHPEVKEVVAAVHYVGQATSRGYGRLSYEVGAEDGVGYIGAAWSPEEERNARFEFSEAMRSYNLQNLRVVEVELLDPVQCLTITEDVDSIIFCATDFDGNRPKAIASLNAAFLFRALASPTKGRVEIEGLVNILGGLKESKQNKIRLARYNNEDVAALNGPNEPTSFVLVSSSTTALGNFETPFGEFNGLKRQAEGIVKNDFPSLSHTVLQMSKFDDNFVDESLDLTYESVSDAQGEMDSDEMYQKSRRKINRRDAARAAVDALVDEELANSSVEVWTALRG